MEEFNPKNIIAHISDKTVIEKLIAKDHLPINEEKSKYLGNLREDVLYFYTCDELEEPSTYQKLTQDMNNQKVGKAILNGKLISEVILKIIKKAQKHHLPFTVVQDPKYQGEIGLVLLKKEKA